MSLQVGSSDLDKMLSSGPAGKICIVFFPWRSENGNGRQHLLSWELWWEALKINGQGV